MDEWMKKEKRWNDRRIDECIKEKSSIVDIGHIWLKKKKRRKTWCYGNWHGGVTEGWMKEKGKKVEGPSYLREN